MLTPSALPDLTEEFLLYGSGAQRNEEMKRRCALASLSWPLCAPPCKHQEPQTLDWFRVTHIIYVPRGPVLPAEVDQRVIGLLDVDQPFSFVRGHRVALQVHFTCSKLHQVLAGACSGAADHAGEESAWRHLWKFLFTKSDGKERKEQRVKEQAAVRSLRDLTSAR